MWEGKTQRREGAKVGAKEGPGWLRRRDETVPKGESWGSPQGAQKDEKLNQQWFAEQLRFTK
jgi:hypothetical protein